MGKCAHIFFISSSSSSVGRGRGATVAAWERTTATVAPVRAKSSYKLRYVQIHRSHSIQLEIVL